MASIKSCILNHDQSNAKDISLYSIHVFTTKPSSHPIGVFGNFDFQIWSTCSTNQSIILPIQMLFERHDTEISTFPKELFSKEYGNLKTLNLSRNKISIVPLTLNFPKLTHLDLKSNLICELPYEITNLKALVFLDLSHNNLTALPWEISTIVPLETLLVNDNKLKWFPCCKWENLKELDLRNNEIKVLSSELSQSVYLSVLRVEGNPLKDISQALVHVRLESTCYETISKLFNEQLGFLAQRTCNQSMDLSGCDFDQIPSALENHYLDLVGLNLSRNNLKSIAPVLHLKKLKKLDLSYNNIHTIPEAIQGLVVLTDLDVSFNKLASLPQELTELKNIKSLKITGNPFQEFEIPVFTSLDDDSKYEIDLLGLTLSRHRFYQIILKNEHIYYQKLNLLKSTFLQGMKQQKFIPEKELNKIFLEIPALIEINRGFLDILEKEVEKNVGKDIDIGTIFIKSSEFFKLYSRFLSSFEECWKLLTEHIQNNSKLKQYIATVSTNYNMAHRDEPVDFLKLFESPIRRITQYVDLLRNLQDLTPRDHPFMESTTKAIDVMDNLFESTKIQKEQLDNVAKIKLLAKELKDETLIQPGRLLVDTYENVDVMDHDAKKSVPTKIYVFTDILLINKIKYPLNLVTLERFEASKSIRLNFVGGSKHLTFGFPMEADQFYATYYIFIEKYWPNFIKLNPPDQMVLSALMTPRGSRSSMILVNSKRNESESAIQRLSSINGSTGMTGSPQISLISQPKRESFKVLNLNRHSSNLTSVVKQSPKISPSNSQNGSPDGSPRYERSGSVGETRDFLISPIIKSPSLLDTRGSIGGMRRQSSSDQLDRRSMDRNGSLPDTTEFRKTRLDTLQEKLTKCVSMFHFEKAHAVLDEMRRVRVSDDETIMKDMILGDQTFKL